MRENLKEKKRDHQDILQDHSKPLILVSCQFLPYGWWRDRLRFSKSAVDDVQHSRSQAVLYGWWKVCAQGVRINFFQKMF